MIYPLCSSLDFWRNMPRPCFRACRPTTQVLIWLVMLCMRVVQAPAPDAMLPIPTHRAAPAEFRLGMHEVSAATQVSRRLRARAGLLRNLILCMPGPNPGCKL